MSRNGSSPSANVVRMSRDRDRFADLPPPDTDRWVPRRKAQVVAAVDRGVLTAEEACERYGLTIEEFESWEQLAKKHGSQGLRVTLLQKYQRRPVRRAY